MIIVSISNKIESLSAVKSIAKNNHTKVVTNKWINLSCLNHSKDSLIGLDITSSQIFYISKKQANGIHNIFYEISLDIYKKNFISKRKIKK